MAVAEKTPTDGYVAIYARISRDQAGRREGVGRQEKWGRAYAEQHWPDVAVRVFSDNDVSAFDDDTHRPGYDTLRAALVAGEVAHLWTVEQTRLEANRRRWIELTVDLEDAGIEEIHTNRDGLVRLDEVADIKNVLSYRERKRLRERLRDTMDDIAAEGRPVLNGTYGYRPGVDPEGRKTVDVVPLEAAVLRWMASAILSGWAREKIATRLNELNTIRWAFGLPGCPPKRAGRMVKGKPASARWVGNKVRSVLTKPAIVGLRVHRGEILRGGNWEPILDEVTWRRVCAEMEPRRRGSRPKRYLQSGWLWCTCGHRMTGRKIRPDTVTWARQYYCMKDLNRDGCGKRSISAESLDAHVIARFLERIDTPEFRAALAADSSAHRRDELVGALADVDLRRRSLAKRWGAGGLTDHEWDDARAALEQRQASLRADLAALPAPPVEVDVDAVLSGWHHLTDDERRMVMGLWITRVEIGPGKRGRKFDTERIRIVWR